MTEPAALEATTLAATTAALDLPDQEPIKVTWHSFDLRSGRRGVQVTARALGAFGRIIGEPTEAQMAVMCWDNAEQAPVPGWEAATDPGRTMLVALDEDEQPLWGGMVLRRRSGPGSWVDCDLVTIEGYFDRRYVQSHEWTARDQASVIAKGVINDASQLELGIELTVDAPAAGITRTRSYSTDEDKTVLSVLQDLMGVQDGPEFTVDLEWADADRLLLKRVVRVRNRLGRAAALPDAVFEMPGCVTDFEYVEDYSSEHGANSVTAVSSGEGEARPESDTMLDLDLYDAGWALFEHRFTPSTSITNTAVLDGHARRELANMRLGLRELTLTAHLSSAPRPGRDFHLGDDVAAVLTCPRFPARVDADGATVPGYEKNLRCIGWDIDLDADQLAPRLVEVD